MKTTIAAAALLFAFTSACAKSSDQNGPAESEVGSNATTEARSVMSDISRQPNFAWLRKLKQSYPAEYSAIETLLTEQIEAGSTKVEARVAAMKTIRPFMDRHKTTALMAPDHELVEYARRNLDVAEALQKTDVKACTDVFRGNLDPTTEFSDDVWLKMSAATEQLLNASSVAEAKPVQGRNPRLLQEDIQLWSAAMESVGANQSSFALLNDRVSLEAASDADKCTVRIQMMKGALKLPQELSAKITLNMLSPNR